MDSKIEPNTLLIGYWQKHIYIIFEYDEDPTKHVANLVLRVPINVIVRCWIHRDALILTHDAKFYAQYLAFGSAYSSASVAQVQVQITDQMMAAQQFVSGPVDSWLTSFVMWANSTSEYRWYAVVHFKAHQFYGHDAHFVTIFLWYNSQSLYVKLSM